MESRCSRCAGGVKQQAVLEMPAAAVAHVRLSAGKEVPPEVEMSIPGLDWGVDEVMGKETKKVPQKKVPYAKPIPAQFQQVAEDGQELVPNLSAILVLLFISQLDELPE